jgi:hypothetical protein
MPYSDFELAQMQAEALFVHDANGKMLRVNEPEPEPIVAAPCFFFTRTAAGNLWRTRYDLSNAITRELERLAADEPVVDNLDEPLLYATDYADLLKERAGTVTTVFGPAYWLPELEPAREAVMITPNNVMLLETHFLWLVTSLSAYAPVSAVIADDAAVAVCFCSRITARVAEAGVFTAEAYRGHGYATNTVRGWAAGVRATGRLPLYSTSSTNIASQSIAQKLGAVQYAVTYSIV